MATIGNTITLYRDEQTNEPLLWLEYVEDQGKASGYFSPKNRWAGQTGWVACNDQGCVPVGQHESCDSIRQDWLACFPEYRDNVRETADA